VSVRSCVSRVGRYTLTSSTVLFTATKMWVFPGGGGRLGGTVKHSDGLTTMAAWQFSLWNTSILPLTAAAAPSLKYPVWANSDSMYM